MQASFLNEMHQKAAIMGSSDVWIWYLRVNFPIPREKPRA